MPPSSSCPLCFSLGVALLFEKSEPCWGRREYWRCPVCRLVFVPRPFHLCPSKERRHYDRHENDPSDPRYRAFLSRLARPLCERLPAGARGLDFGCGPGPALAAMLGEMGHPTARYDSFYYPEGRLLIGRYDFVTCTEVAEHFREPRAEWALLGRLVPRPGGRIAVMTEIFGPEQEFSSWWYHRDPTHLCFYELATFKWLARWLGMTLDQVAPTVVIFERP